MDGKNNRNINDMTELAAALVDAVRTARDQGWEIKAVRVSKITDPDIPEDEDETPWGQVEAMLDACEDSKEDGTDDGRFDSDDVCMIVNVAGIATAVEIMGSALKLLENPCSGDDEFDAKVKTAAEVIGSTLDMVYKTCEEAREAIFDDGGEE